MSADVSLARRVRPLGARGFRAIAAWRGVWFCGALLAAYTLPMIVFASSREYFAYTNAWDEENYLSYQNAVSNRTLPGYFAAASLVALLHRLGLSGALQNVLFDLLTPATMVGVMAFLMVRHGVERQRALLYGSLVTFGTALINRGNPLVFWLVGQEYPWLAPAFEPYPSILRTPNPQISYLFIAIGLTLAWRLRSFWPLVLPLPFLYWAVGVGYLYAVAAAWGWRRWAPATTGRCVLVAGGAALAIGLVAFTAFSVIGLTFPRLSHTRFSTPFSDPMISVAMALGLVAAGITLALDRREALLSLRTRYGVVAAATLLVFVTNLQVFTRIRLEPKNIQDYFAGFVALGLMLVAFHTASEAAIRHYPGDRARRVASAALALVCLVTVGMVMRSQGFQWERLRYQVMVNMPISARDVARIKADPLHAIIPSRHAAGKVSLIAPALLAPPFSYLYAFPGVNTTCSHNPALHDRAIAFARLRAETDPAWATALPTLESLYADYREREALFHDRPYRDLPLLCDPARYAGDDFYLVDVGEGPLWAYFP